MGQGHGVEPADAALAEVGQDDSRAGVDAVRHAAAVDQEVCATRGDQQRVAMAHREAR